MLSLLDDPGDRNPEINDLVLADPGLTLGLLLEANRALSGAGIEVTSISVALEVLGKSTCRRIVDAGLQHWGPPKDPDSLERYLAALRHSIVASLAAGSLAAMLESATPGEARSAGLLHDVGLLNGPESADEAEDHQDFARKLLARSTLPERLARAVGGHHGDGRAWREDEEVLVSLLQLADRFAVAEGAPAEGDQIIELEDCDQRMRDLGEIVHERVARDVADGLLVLGVLLGQPGLDVGNLPETFRELLAGQPILAPLPEGLTRMVHTSLREIREAGSEPGALHALLRAVRSTQDVERTLLVLEEAGEAMVAGSSGPPPFYVRTRELAAVAEGWSEFLLLVQREGRSAVVRRGMGFDGVFGAFSAEEILAIPVRAGKQPVGTVLVPSRTTLPGGLGATFEVLAHAVGEVMERAQLSRRSFLLTERITKDSLTGVLQRGHLMELLEAEIRVANHYRRAFALVMLDVDNFKDWNDTYGHQVGDNLLRDVARVILDCSREGDLVGRYGGDEFVIVLPGQNAEQASKYAERVRSRVEGLSGIMAGVYELDLSVSLGVAAVTSYPAESGTLMFRADHALYRAKERGRNRVHAEQA